MKPDWDKLMAEYEHSDEFVVADVDCTSDGGQPLCQKNNIGGYPTVKWGYSDNLQDYSGGRGYDALSNFVQENILTIPKKGAIDKLIKQLKLEPLKKDFDHILKLRKNAAVVLIVIGIILGLVLGQLLSCLTRKKAKIA